MPSPSYSGRNERQRHPRSARQRLTLLTVLTEVISSLIEAFIRLFVPKRPKSLVDDTVLITGGAKGIGCQLAKQLAAEHGVRKMVLWDMDGEAGEETARNGQLELAREEVRQMMGEKGMCWSFKCDVSDRAQVAQVAQKTRTACGRITILINNAGIMPAKPFLDFDAADVRRIHEVNVFSQFWTLFEYLPDMLENGGHIVSVCSVAGVTAASFLIPYCASKHAIKGLMTGLEAELHDNYGSDCKVKLTTVYPFTVNTGLAHEPTTRFPSIFPITEPDDCARKIIGAVRREDPDIYIPAQCEIAFKLTAFLPKRAQAIMADYFECRVGYKFD